MVRMIFPISISIFLLIVVLFILYARPSIILVNQTDEIISIIALQAESNNVEPTLKEMRNQVRRQLKPSEVFRLRFSIKTLWVKDGMRFSIGWSGKGQSTTIATGSQQFLSSSKGRKCHIRLEINQKNYNINEEGKGWCYRPLSLFRSKYSYGSSILE